MQQKMSKVRVSEMDQLSRIEADAMLLVIQNGNSYRVSFSDLKKKIMEDIQNETTKQKKLLESVLKAQEECSENTQKNIDQKFLDLQKTTEIEIKKILDENQQIDNKLKAFEDKAEDISRSIQSYKNDNDINSQISELINSKNSVQEKISSIQKDFSEKFADIQNTAEKTQSQMMSKIDRSFDEVNKTLKTCLDKEKDVVQKEQEISSYIQSSQMKILDKINALSSSIEKLDIGLYGLTVEDIDIDTLDVSSKQISSGCINQLSAEISQIKTQLEYKHSRKNSSKSQSKI